ncbi:hypothetical protein UF64_15255 [Thalassospira sp. HJ]|uniref:hypothetical protein n=1 Tax=Thalassospira sp. HJ TaxID=1616823 RepID=UPI0005CF4816|nr:hypothetical protein [Thalassospira sp. HJ]KJE34427.1 hypothetical protein UF64_15255 [Thalassospira sp. HJ]
MKHLSTEISENKLISGQYGDIHFGPWGLECSDRHSFVTITDQPRNAILRDDIWHLSDGRLQIKYETEQTSSNTIRLCLSVEALNDIPLQDAVIRLVFDKNAITHGIIAGRTFTHCNSDKYRLYPIKQVQLVGQDGGTITVRLEDADGAGRFDPYMYLRDRDDHWIIHARLLPCDPVDQVWLRWANRFFTLSAPNGVSRFLWRISPIKKLLWRLRERAGRRCPEIQAVPLNHLKAGQSLGLEVTCHFD